MRKDLRVERFIRIFLTSSKSIHCNGLSYGEESIH